MSLAACVHGPNHVLVRGVVCVRASIADCNTRKQITSPHSTQAHMFALIRTTQALFFHYRTYYDTPQDKSWFDDTESHPTSVKSESSSSKDPEVPPVCYKMCKIFSMSRSTSVDVLII
jgi:hypothetical protein